jgi:hypothetical protein
MNSSSSSTDPLSSSEVQYNGLQGPVRSWPSHRSSAYEGYSVFRALPPKDTEPIEAAVPQDLGTVLELYEHCQQSEKSCAQYRIVVAVSGRVLALCDRMRRALQIFENRNSDKAKWTVDGIILKHENEA